ISEGDWVERYYGRVGGVGCIFCGVLFYCSGWLYGMGIMEWKCRGCVVEWNGGEEDEVGRDEVWGSRWEGEDGGMVY
ncbi:hypothetical protein, partial [Paenibacillus xylanexedens]|uniref:hypothetical protein n=1 Tax=Paenibacillus xylanexedens TaxID=528191 RepID=UPI001C93155C